MGATTSDGPDPFFRETRNARGLHGFSETHVVGENPVEPVGREEVEPAESVALVGPQIGFERRRNPGRGQGLDAGEPSPQIRERPHRGARLQVHLHRQPAGRQVIDPQGAVWIVTRPEKMGHMLANLHKPPGGKPQVFIGIRDRKEEEFREVGGLGIGQAAGKGLRDVRDQRDALVADLPGDIKPEPIDSPLGILFQFRPEFAHIDDLEFGLPRHLDFPAPPPPDRPDGIP